MMVYKTLLTSQVDGVRTITLNRPASRNAMTPEMQDELTLALNRAADGPSRVVVLTGAGEAFCAGLDLVHLQEIASTSTSDHAAEAGRVARLFYTLYQMPKPTIAAVNGAAIAGGTGLATICDFTLAVPAAKFGYTEVRIGFVPAVVSAFLALQIGDKRARDLLLTGRLFTAEEAQKLGLVNEVVEPDQLATRVQELAKVLKANSPQSMAATKRLLVAQNKDWLDDAIHAAISTNVEVRSLPDFYEGVTAFLEKRKPVWGKER